MRCLSAAIVLCASLLLPSEVRAQGPADVDAGIKKLMADLSAAFNKADAKALTNMYAPDAVDIQADGKVIRGHAALEDFTKTAFGGAYKGTNVRIALGGTRLIKPDVAVAWGTYDITAAGRPPERATFLLTLRRQDQRWLIEAGLAGLLPK